MKQGLMKCKITNMPIFKCLQVCSPCFNKGRCIRQEMSEFDPEVEKEKPTIDIIDFIIDTYT